MNLSFMLIYLLMICMSILKCCFKCFVEIEIFYDEYKDMDRKGKILFLKYTLFKITTVSYVRILLIQRVISLNGFILKPNI